MGAYIEFRPQLKMTETDELKKHSLLPGSVIKQ